MATTLCLGFCGRGEARGHRGVATHGEWRLHKDARSVCGSHHRTPRPVQTGGGHSAAPLSIQLCLWVGSLRRWVTARRLPGRHSSVTASPLRCRTGLLAGRRGFGALKVVFCSQAHAGHW